MKKITFFELLPKTCNFTICSILSNSGHVGWCTTNYLEIDVKFKLQKCAACQDLPTLQFWSKSHYPFWPIMQIRKKGGWPKTCNFTICSILSNSGHVGWCTTSPDTILKLDTLVMIQTKFGFHWSYTFRGEDFWESLRRTTDDDVALF
jgi:hypothetical protein